MQMGIDSLNYRRSVDPAGLIVFRFGFGLLMVFSTIRYWYMGWIEELLLLPHVRPHHLELPVRLHFLVLVRGLLELQLLLLPHQLDPLRLQLDPPKL